MCGGDRPPTSSDAAVPGIGGGSGRSSSVIRVQGSLKDDHVFVKNVQERTAITRWTWESVLATATNASPSGPLLHDNDHHQHAHRSRAPDGEGYDRGLPRRHRVRADARCESPRPPQRRDRLPTTGSASSTSTGPSRAFPRWPNNPAWSGGARNHSCWMLLNGIAHDENPGTPGYTPDGDQAGNSGNVAVSSSRRRNGTQPHRPLDDRAVPRHRPAAALVAAGGLRNVREPAQPVQHPWKSGATLDVVRGNSWGAAKPATPVVFPGNGATTSLTRFVAESPDPRTFCGWGGQERRSPTDRDDAVERHARRRRPSSAQRDPSRHACCTRRTRAGTASAILGGDNAVVVVPAAPLDDRHLLGGGRVQRWHRELELQRRPVGAAGSHRPSRPPTSKRARPERTIPTGHPVPIRRLTAEPTSGRASRRPTDPCQGRRYARDPGRRHSDQRQLHHHRARWRRLPDRLQLPRRRARRCRRSTTSGSRPCRTRRSSHSIAATSACSRSPAPTSSSTSTVTWHRAAARRSTPSSRNDSSTRGRPSC